MENIIVLIIVGISVLYIILKIWKTFSSSSRVACGCGCSGCGAASSCDKEPEAGQLRE